MRVLLVSMKGLQDTLLRKLLMEINNSDLCAAELFVRVVNTLLLKKTFYYLSHELLNQGYTKSGLLVCVQLLGSSPE